MPNFAPTNAPVAKLVDAPDLGSGVVRRVGSSPITRTSFRIETDKSPRNYPISRAFLY